MVCRRPSRGSRKVVSLLGKISEAWSSACHILVRQFLQAAQHRPEQYYEQKQVQEGKANLNTVEEPQAKSKQVDELLKQVSERKASL